MGTHTRHVVRGLAVAIMAAAVVPPVAQAIGPDDRPYYRGMSPASTSGSPSPDDRAFYRGGSDRLAPASISPDDRAFARSAVETEPAPVTAAVARSDGFDWGDAVMGGAFSLALALLGTGAILVAYRRRGSLGTA
jgi:hypothetical protein